MGALSLMGSDAIYPLTFEPAFRQYIWGGRNLERLGRALPPGKVAESWEISGHRAAATAVAAGSLAGRLLTDLVCELGPALLGSRNSPALERGRFPLLVKLLDAQDRLSIQVHPPDAYARLHEAGEPGKSEMWYILEAASDARIIYGLRQGVTPKRFRQALEAGDLERWLHYLPARPRDAILIEAGALHALLGGVLAVEIQQDSDVTYRVYDWGRLDADGKPRPLHVEKALDVIDFDRVEPGPYAPRPVESRPGLRREIISACQAFTVERLRLDGNARFDGRCDGSTFEIWGCVEGSARILWEGEPLPLPAVRFALLPAALGEFAVQTAGEPATLLRAWAGG